MKKIIKTALIWAVMLLPIVSVAMPLAYVEGVHYKPTAKRLATGDKDVVEVVELFSYSCPHCFRFEPQLMEWKKTLPDNVKFVQVPAIFRDSWLQLAKVYYTAEKMGELEKLQPLIFNAIHVDKRRLQTEDQLLDFVAEQGVDREVFAKEMKSMSVTRNVKEALLMSQTSGITGVPSMIVNGKYIVDGPMAGSMEEVLKVVDYLIQQELN